MLLLKDVKMHFFLSVLILPVCLTFFAVFFLSKGVLKIPCKFTPINCNYYNPRIVVFKACLHLSNITVKAL